MEANEMSEGIEPTDAQMAEELMELSGETHEAAPAEAGQSAEGETKTEAPTETEPTYDVNGKKLTVKELIAGNMMREDYTRKTQEAAEMRREAEAMHQKRILDDMFREAPGRAEAEAHLAAQGDLTPDEVALLDPVSKKAYDVAVEARSRVEAMENRAIQREKYEQGQSMMRSLDDFRDILVKQHGMDPLEAENRTAEVAATARKEGLPYNVKGFQLIFNASRDVNAEAERIAKQRFDEYLAQKAKDATAGLAGGTAGAFDPGAQKINPWKLEQEDPEALNRAMADDL